MYHEEFAEPRETEKYEYYTSILWELLTEKFKPFNCAKRCKAPSGFFNGQPWLFDEHSIINKVRILISGFKVIHVLFYPPIVESRGQVNYYLADLVRRV